MSSDIFSEYAELVRRYKAGDEFAFTEIYEKSSRFVYMTCLSVLGNKDDAEEAMQETYLAVFKDIGSLADENKLIGWIKGIAAFKSYDILRKKKGNVSYDDAIASEDILEGDDDLESLPDYYINQKAKREQLHKIIKKELSDVQYQTVLFHYFNEMSVEDIASLMSCPEGTVKTRLKAARIKIKAAIEKYEKDNDDKLAAIMGVPFLARFFKEEAMGLTAPDMSSIIRTPSGEDIPAESKAGSPSRSPKGGSGASPSGAKPGFLATAGGKITVALISAAFLVTAGLIIKTLMDHPKDRDDDEDEEIEEVETEEIMRTEPVETSEHERSDAHDAGDPAASSALSETSEETTEETSPDPYSSVDTGWSDAYAEVVTNIDVGEIPDYYRSEMTSDDVLCKLAYINDDQVPELILSFRDEYNEYYIMLYTFADGEAVFLDDFGMSTNAIDYVPGGNLIDAGGGAIYLDDGAAPAFSRSVYWMTEDCTELDHVSLYNTNYVINDPSTITTTVAGEGYDFYFTWNSDDGYVEITEDRFHELIGADLEKEELLGEYEVSDFLALLPGDYSDIYVPDYYPLPTPEPVYNGEEAVPIEDIQPA